jgi:O-antigen/teichoic acid export membrane protein
MKLYKRLITYFLSGAIVKILPIIVLPILAVYLTPEDMGKLSNFNVLVSLLIGAIGMRLSKYVEIEYHNYENKKHGIGPVITTILVIHILLVFVSLILIFLFRNALENILRIDSKFLLLSVIVAFGTVIATTRSALLRFSENVKEFVAFNILQSALLAILSIIFIVLLKFGWEARAYSYILTGFHY